MIKNHKDPIKKNFIARVVAFSISGTYIVDLKDSSPASRVANKL